MGKDSLLERGHRDRPRTPAFAEFTHAYRRTWLNLI